MEATADEAAVMAMERMAAMEAAEFSTMGCCHSKTITMVDSIRTNKTPWATL